MAQELGRLTPTGINEFRRWLAWLRDNPELRIPPSLFAGDEFVEAVEPSILIEQSVFSTRFELGEYLVDKLSDLDQQKLLHDSGLWSWLGFFYFDQLCPTTSGGGRKPREDYTYVLSRNFRHYPRHALRTTYLYVRDYGEKVRFMFSKKPSERGEIVEQLTARQELAASPKVIEAASLLYSDNEHATFKRGAAGNGKGSVRRFVQILQQLQQTYDLFTVPPDRLVELLPVEFKRFKPGAS